MKKYFLRQPHTLNLKIIISQNSTQTKTIFKENNVKFMGNTGTF